MQTPNLKPMISRFGAALRGILYALIAAGFCIIETPEAKDYVPAIILFWMKPILAALGIWRVHIDQSHAMSKGATTDTDPPYESPPPQARFQPESGAVMKMESENQ